MVSLKYRVSGAFKPGLQMLSLKGWNLAGATLLTMGYTT